MAKAPRKRFKPAADSPAKSKAKKTPARKAEVVETKAVNPEIIHGDLIDDTSVEPESTLREEVLRSEFDTMDDIVIDPDRDVLEELDPAKVLGTEKPLRRAITPEVVDRENSSRSLSSKAVTTSDPVSIYLAEIRKYPLLTKERERELALLYRETGDSKAAELLVTSNLRFVVKVAAEYSRFGAKLIDLIQEGNVGLMHAVREFNPYKGVRLITYAVWWIRGYIQEYLMRQYSMVRIGTTQNQRKLFYRLQKERDLLNSMGHSPDVKLLAGRLGVTEEEVETMTKRLSGRDVSLNTPLDNGSSASSLLDFEQSTDEAVDETLGHLEEMKVLKDNLEKIRKTLNPKETYILENRLLADDPMTLQEIGEHYKVTREAVRQLEARLIQKIRVAVTASLGEGDE
jgi:RNA polymerase sigma-32 factor